VTNGMIGAWGPVVTPFLLHRSVRPRYAIGCVNTAEVAVASASAFSLLASIGRGGINGPTVLSLLFGGVLAAPVAAWFIRHVAPGPMGVSVAGLLLLTNARDLTAWAGLKSGPALWAVYASILVVTAVALVSARRHAGRRATAGDQGAADPIDASSSEGLSR